MIIHAIIRLPMSQVEAMELEFRSLALQAMLEELESHF
jgi:hypothetical protein